MQLSLLFALILEEKATIQERPSFILGGGAPLPPLDVLTTLHTIEHMNLFFNEMKKNKQKCLNLVLFKRPALEWDHMPLTHCYQQFTYTHYNKKLLNFKVLMVFLA